VQQVLQLAFETWGLPQRIRVDHGTPWGNWSDLPPALSLWWQGLGITPVWNPPASPQHNAKVERCNGLLASWGEPEQNADFAAWEERVAWVARTQRESYPAIQGQSRLAAYPALAGNPRVYRRRAEAEQFDVGRVRAYLGPGRWPRLVSKSGQIALYGKAYGVGKAWKGEQVWVRLDAAMNEWVVQGADGEEVIRHAAEQLRAERIRQLDVAHPRPPSKKKKRPNFMAPSPS
jgi:hypothetical protein